MQLTRAAAWLNESALRFARQWNC